MYCPNCGTKTSSDQKFCRGCGLGLEKIALSLNEQLPAKVDLSLQQQKERFEKLGVAALSVFGLGVLGVIIYGIIYKLMISGGSILTGLAALGFIIMVVCGLASVVLFAKANEAGEAATESGPTQELLTEGHFEPVPSITDRTTELLAVENGDRERR